MKIKIIEEGRSIINLPIPYFFLKSYIKKKKIFNKKLSSSFLKMSIKELKKFRRENGSFNFIEVESSDGSKIVIVI